MVSTFNVAAVALGALVFWTCLGSAIARRVLPPTLALPFAPTIGWAVHSVLALPILSVIGVSQASVIALALVALLARVALARGWPHAAAGEPQPRVPAWAYAAAALLALAPAIALLPKSVADGVILAGPIYDHAKIAMIDEMARLGVPPGNPFFGEGGGPTRLVYYYLWHFSAAELAAAFRISGWAADIALTFVTAFASLAAMMGLAVRLGGRRGAALWVVPLALAASLRPVLYMLWSADRLDAVLLPGTGFAGWLFQSAWVPQHLMAASCVVAAVMVMSSLAERGLLRLIVLALLAAAAFESSTWVGGVTFAPAAAAIGAVLLWWAEAGERWRLLARFALAAVLTVVLAAPFLRDQLALASARDGPPAVTLDPFAVLGPALPDHLRHLLDLPAYWLVLLPVEFPAIIFTGALAATVLLRATSDRAVRREGTLLALLALIALAVGWLLASTLGGNNDLGWRAVLPAVAALTAFAAAGLARAHASRRWLALAGALVAIALGLPRSVEILRDDASGRNQPDAAAFARAPAMWAAVRRHSLPDERVGNDPLALRAATPWPVNIGWALMANRRSCYAGRELALVFTGLPPGRRGEIDGQFVRVFAGEGSPDDVRDLAMRYGCRVIALTAADGAWQRDPFAASPFYRLVERREDEWRIYRAVSPGDGGYRP